MLANLEKIKALPFSRDKLLTVIIRRCEESKIKFSPELPGKTPYIPVNLLIPEDCIEKLKTISDTSGKNRNCVLLSIISNYLESEDFKQLEKMLG